MARPSLDSFFTKQPLRPPLDSFKKQSLSELQAAQATAEAEAGVSTTRRFGRELWQNVVGSVPKVITSAIETPKTLVTGKASQKTYDLKGLGIDPFKSFISEAETRAGDIIEGKKPLYTALAPFIEVPLAVIETATTGVLGLKTAGKVLPTAGRVLKKAGEKMTGIGVKMDEATAKALMAYQGNKPTLFERVRGLFGKSVPKAIKPPITEANTAVRLLPGGKTEWQLGTWAGRVKDRLWGGIIDPALKADKTPVDMRTFFQEARKTIIRENAELTRRYSLLEALDAIQDDYKSVSNVSLYKLQNYKSGWAKLVPDKAYKGKPIAGAYNEVRNWLAKNARNLIYNRLGNKVKTAYIDHGNLTSIEEFAVKTRDALRTKGGSKQAWEFVLDKILTPIATFGGKVLYRTGEGMEFVGEKGAKKLSDLLFSNVGIVASKGSQMFDDISNSLTQYRK